jgi:hypothetical protein
VIWTPDVLARRIAAWVVARTHPSNREWALAMSAEIDAVESGFARLQWAVSAMRMVWMRPTRVAASTSGTGADLRGMRNEVQWIGPVGRNAIALFVTWLAVSGAVVLGGADRPDGQMFVMTLGMLIGWIGALAVRAGFMAYLVGGQVVFGLVETAYHLAFGIEKVQGGGTHFSVMGAATLAAIMAAGLVSRIARPDDSPIWDARDLTASAARALARMPIRRRPFAFVMVAVIAIAINELPWIAIFGKWAFRDLESHFAVASAAVLGVGFGLVTERRLRRPRVSTLVMEH